MPHNECKPHKSLPEDITPNTMDQTKTYLDADDIIRLEITKKNKGWAFTSSRTLNNLLTVKMLNIKQDKSISACFLDFNFHFHSQWPEDAERRNVR